VDPSIGYVFDRSGVLKITGNSISVPTPHVTQTPIPPFFDGSGAPVMSFVCPGTSDVEIGGSMPPLSGTVTAFLRDPAGNLDPATEVQAILTIVIHGVTCSLSGNDQILSKVLDLNPNVAVGAPRTDVFGASNIIIQPPFPTAWVAVGCGSPTPTTPCPFPLGIVEFKTKHDIQVALPATASFQAGEVYRAVRSTKFVGVRDCKGATNSADPSTIVCPVVVDGGGVAQGLFTFAGNWSGATNHTINPGSGTNPFDIDLSTQPSASILPNTVTASANNGPEVPNSGCNDMPSQSRERCFFSANALLPNGCPPNTNVNVLVRGRLDIGGAEFGFVSRDNPICSLNK
jgi:hypothetical protein